LVSLLAHILLAGVCRAAPERLAPNRDWGAIINDDNLKKLAPKDGLITNAKEFAKLWKAWRKDEKTPEINFEKEFVLVTLAIGPNRSSISATLDDGKLTVRAVQTLKAGPGFGYSIATFNRKGIKTVNGKDLPAK